MARRATRAFVLGRRRKGRRNGRVVRDVRAALEAAGWKAGSVLVRRKSELRKVAKAKVKAGYDVIVTVGGDGAVLQVATAVAASRAALGIVPTGTGNLLAGNLGIPADPSKAARVILDGRRRSIDMGRATLDGKDHDFAVACGVGYDAEVMDATGPSEKLRWGKAAYLANAIGQIGEIRNVPHELTIDGEPMAFDAAQVFIANFGRLLPLVQPRRRIRPDDGRLDVIAVRASGPLPGLLASWDVMRQTKLGVTGGGRVLRTRARRVRLETTPRRLVEADGSVIGRTPLEIVVLPQALTVLVPES
jgi:diacylglycerol kinase family enzyme